MSNIYEKARQLTVMDISIIYYSVTHASRSLKLLKQLFFSRRTGSYPSWWKISCFEALVVREVYYIRTRIIRRRKRKMTRSCFFSQLLYFFSQVFCNNCCKGEVHPRSIFVYFIIHNTSADLRVFGLDSRNVVQYCSRTLAHFRETFCEESALETNRILRNARSVL